MAQCIVLLGPYSHDGWAVWSKREPFSHPWIVYMIYITMTSQGKVYIPFLIVTSYWHGVTQSKVTSSAGLPCKRSCGEKKRVTFFKGPNTFFIFMTRFPRNKSALWDKATKPSATKDECCVAMAQRHRPCIWTRCTHSVACPSESPLSWRQNTRRCLCSCFWAAASLLLHRCRSWLWLREPRFRECESQCLNMGLKEKGQSHTSHLSDLALFYSMSIGSSPKKVKWRKVKLLLNPSPSSKLAQLIAKGNKWRLSCSLQYWIPKWGISITLFLLYHPVQWKDRKERK